MGDVLAGRRAPEPLFFRANSGSLVEYWLTNLLPGYYELDDFQVRTPTDIVGQHIHLVKFDVTSSDGAANGFNYQDGSYGPDEVQTPDRRDQCRPAALYTFDLSRAERPQRRDRRRSSGRRPERSVVDGRPDHRAALVRRPARQQGVADARRAPPRYEDRTLQSVFTHDHFGPSTHQQVGLYAALIIEPKWSSWFDSGDRGPARRPRRRRPHELAGDDRSPGRTVRASPSSASSSSSSRTSSSPTTRRATRSKPYVPYPYTVGSRALPVPPWGWIDTATPGGGTHAIAPPGNGERSRRIISGSPEPGGAVVNYRSEPIPFRVGIAAGHGAEPTAHDPAHDLSHAFRSIERDDPIPATSSPVPTST